ncbi:MAG: 1-acyl-sn-glycerol-3-phosphate acyltransferase [Bacteroidales bacterium]|nr:1-acyl-sn-glycerol-3-phosphate acyltransferase [Bacteroidales bacterium]
MRKVILSIFDFLSQRKRTAAAALVVLTVVMAALASRLGYSEDIAAFLPGDEVSGQYSEVYDRIGGQDKVAVIFSGDSPDEIVDAMYAFEENWNGSEAGKIASVRAAAVDEQDEEQVLSFISSNIPYFLEAKDFERMDSLLAAPGYIRGRLEKVKNSLQSPLELSAWHAASDPLSLFDPVYLSLQGLNPGSGGTLRDGCLMTPDGRHGVLFFNSPYGGSESSDNATLDAFVNQTARQTEEAFPSVSITSTGGPLVAAGNAGTIKKDSLLALSLALLLICILLYFSYKRLSDVAWIAVSVLLGGLFALGMISLLRSTISIIILGIGSTILGIAVNYPLHYVDHLKYRPDRRQALADQISPLLTGNITTVGAFLSMLLLKSEALRDFGLTGALMLVGTILFVLLFLPVFASPSPKPRRTLNLGFEISIPSRFRTPVFLLFVCMTVLLWALGRNVSFDADMGHINYMSAEQKEGFSLLASLGGDASKTAFIVTKGTDTEAVLEEARAVAAKTGAAGISAFLPSKAAQEKALARWRDFKKAHSGLPSTLLEEAASAGFSPTAFGPFMSLWEKDFAIEELPYFAPLASTVGAASVFCDTGSTMIVSRIEGKASEIRPSISTFGSSFCYDSSDVSSRLASGLSEDFDKIGLVCSLIVLLFLCLSFSSLELGLTAFLPLAVAWFWILGIMHVFGLSFNIVNVVLAAFIFGQGDDYSIFITEGLMYERATGRKILPSFRNSVVLSALIMFIGIGALITATHPAMRSLAQVTITGMLTVVAMACYLPPTIFGWLTKDKDIPLTLRQLLITALSFAVFLTVCIFISLWTLVCLVLFRGERRQAMLQGAMHQVCKRAVRLVPDAPFTVNNPYGEDFSKSAVCICNHQSNLDLLGLLALSGKFLVLTNDNSWNNIFYGFLIRKAGFLPASMGMDKMLPILREKVANGWSIVIYPEGSRSPDYSITRFHRGAFAIARELGVDILPIYGHGFGHVMPKHSKLMHRGELYLEIGQRISDIPEDLRTFTRDMRHHYRQKYAAICAERENAAYCASFVRYHYLYKGSEVASECRKFLRPEVYAKVDAFRGDSLLIKNAGYGVYPLLVALRHKDMMVYAFESDEEKRLVAEHCSLKPSNLVWCDDSLAPATMTEEL